MLPSHLIENEKHEVSGRRMNIASEVYGNENDEARQSKQECWQEKVTKKVKSTAD
jgi:hypothetical protein